MIYLIMKQNSFTISITIFPVIFPQYKAESCSQWIF